MQRLRHALPQGLPPQSLAVREDQQAAEDDPRAGPSGELAEPSTASAEGQRDRAARLFGAAEALRETLDDKMMPEEKKEYDAQVSALRQVMDTGALQEAWLAGRGMDLDTAVSYALNS